MWYSQYIEDLENQLREVKKMKEPTSINIEIAYLNNICGRIIYLLVNKYVPSGETDIIDSIRTWDELKCSSTLDLIHYMYDKSDKDPTWIQHIYAECINKFYDLVMTNGKFYNRSNIPSKIPNQCPWTLRELYSLSADDLLKKLNVISEIPNENKQKTYKGLKKDINSLYGAVKKDKVEDNPKSQSWRKQACLSAMKTIEYLLVTMDEHPNLSKNEDVMEMVCTTIEMNRKIISNIILGVGYNKGLKIHSFLEESYNLQHKKNPSNPFPEIMATHDDLSMVSVNEILTTNPRDLIELIQERNNFINGLMLNCARSMQIPPKMIFPKGFI